jgi:hypothetical protein
MATYDWYKKLQGDAEKAQFTSPWSDAMNDTIGRIRDREPYRFDLDTNGLYQQYKNQYTKLGQQAMKDTMGQAAGLTGGYGSSYAQNVGQQAYNGYLEKLNNIVPDLYAQGKAAYDADTNNLYNQLAMYGDAYNRDYNTWRDQLGDQRYYEQLAYDRDQAQLDRDWQQKQWDYNVQQDTQNHSYNLAMQMIQSGQVPDAGMLQAAGIDAAYAQKMAGWYARQLAGAGGGKPYSRRYYIKDKGKDKDKDEDKDKDKDKDEDEDEDKKETYAPPTTAEIDAFARRYAHAVNNKLSEESDYGYAMITDFENRFGVDNDLWPRIKQWALDRGYIRGYKNAH